MQGQCFIKLEQQKIFWLVLGPRGHPHGIFCSCVTLKAAEENNFIPNIRIHFDDYAKLRRMKFNIQYTENV